MLLCKREREMMSRMNATEQSQILVFKIPIIRNLWVSSITRHSHEIAPPSSITILTESRVRSLWMDKALSVDEETTTCGWGEVCVCLCIRERGKRSKMNL